MFTRRNFVQNMCTLLMAPGIFPPLLNPALSGPETGSASSVNEQDDLLKIEALLKAKEPVIWVFAGDSITQGAKHTLGYRSYPEIFAERVRWEMGRVRDIVINSGVSGNTSQDVLNDYEWRIGQFKPAVVSLMIGTNDAAIQKNISTDLFRKNTIALISRIRRSGAIPILQTPNTIIIEKAAGRERLQEYIEVTRAVAKEHIVVLVDHWAYWSEKQKSLSGGTVQLQWLNDALHPNGKGHLQMAQLLFRKLSIFDPSSFTGSEKEISD